MAGDWIKMRANLANDPAVIGVASRLETSEYEVVGLLHALWSWADQHTVDGQAVGVSLDWVDRHLRCPGLAEALVSVGWLAHLDGVLTFPRFDRHNGKSAKRRALNSEAQRASRSRRDVAPVSKPKQAPAKEPALGEPWESDPVFMAAWKEWCAYRKERKLAMYKSVALKKRLSEVEEHGVDAFVAAVDKSISNNWNGLFYDKKQAAAPTRRYEEYEQAEGSGPDLA